MIICLAVNESRNFDKVEIIINCPQIDKQLDRLIHEINQFSISLTGTKVQFVSSY